VSGVTAYRQTVQTYVARRIRPRADAWEREGACPRRALLAAARAGLVSIDPRRAAIVAEELPRGQSHGFALALFVQASLVAPLLDTRGTRAQRTQWLTPLLQGRALGAVAVTEPGAGSDVGAITASARRDGDHYVLNGEKVYITAAAVADLLVTAARTGGEKGVDALSLFLGPARARGVHVDAQRLMGLNTSGPARIRLHDVRIPRGALLGAEGDGFAAIQDGLARERLFGGIAAVAWAGQALERTRAWMRARSVFGRRLSELQVLRHRVADVATALEAARCLNTVTLDRWIRGEPTAKQIAMIKLFSYRAAADTIDACLQMYGGAGYVDDHWAGRAYRDARALTIAAGTPDVMRELIAAHLRV
jgi:acyl-CoA dehydrogenase